MEFTCGQCINFSSVHPYKEGICLKHLSVDKEKQRFKSEKISVYNEICDYFSHFSDTLIRMVEYGSQSSSN